MKFRGRQGHHVLVITAYQVSQSSPSGLGHETFYMQQWRKIVLTIPTDEPRKRFWTDLTTFISLAPNNTAILLMLDANADTSDPLFSRFCSDCNLEDFHGNVSLQPAPETYFRGSRRIDYILGTPDIAQAITQVGILGYADGLKYSDHHALFIDIQEDLLFSDKGVDPTARRSRGLQTKKSKQVQEYCCLLKQQCAAHNILSWVRGLCDLARNQGSLAAKTAADVIDSQLTAFALKAERDTSNKSFGYAWSPTLADAGRSVTFWRNCLRMVKAGADPFASLLPSQLITQSGLRPTLAMSFYQARLADAWTKLRTIQAKATELRAEFLDSLCDAAECHTEKARATCIRGIKKAEYMQRLWPKLRRFAKGEVWTGLSRIEVPIFDASQEIVGWRSITSPDELFTALIDRNIRHFSQAKLLMVSLGSICTPLNKTISPNQF